MERPFAGSPLADAARHRYPPAAPVRLGDLRSGPKVYLATLLCVAIVVAVVAGLATSVVGEVPGPHPRYGAYRHGLPIWRVVTASGAAFGAVFMFRRRIRIRDTPTVEVAGAHPGVCELTGTVRADRPVMSWFTNTPCVAYRSTIERRSGKRTRVVWSRSEHAGHITLSDGTGRITLNGDDVERSGPLRGALGERADGHTYREMVLVEGDEIYLLATCRLAPDGTLVVQRLPSPGEPSQALTREWHGSHRGERHASRSMLLLSLGATLIAWCSLVSLFVFDVWSAGYSRRRRHTVLLTRFDHPVTALAVCAAITAAFVLVAVVIVWYNRLVMLREQVEYSAANIDVAVGQRHELIGALAETARASATHERQVWPELAGGRSDAVASAAIVARVEANPQLRSNESFRSLFDGLVATENRIAAARRFHNDAVTAARDRAQAFPASLIAPIVFKGGLPAPLQLDGV